MECDKICEMNNEPCQQKDCRQWIDYKEDLNCTLICANKNGSLTLREVAKRMGISYVRVKQIEEAALKKIKQKKSVYGIKQKIILFIMLLLV